MIIDRVFNFDIKYNKSHFPIEFALGEDHKSLEIYFNYSPTLVPRETSACQSLECIKRYAPNKINDKNFLDLDTVELVNIITLSLFQEGEYIGVRHSGDLPQLLVISEDRSSLGFLKRKISKGNYTIKLNIHNVLSPVRVKLQVRAEK
ncbi:MAG: hypothetical protein GX219_07610 [Tissierellia bacterium]|nr:hypothetical protein [Tissierellia bacterium]